MASVTTAPAKTRADAAGQRRQPGIIRAAVDDGRDPGCRRFEIGAAVAASPVVKIAVRARRTP
jgi:hypothetical protein